MGIARGTLCGIRKFALKLCILDWHQVQGFLLWVHEWDGTVSLPTIRRSKRTWTGKRILSLTVPRGINICRANEWKKPNPVEDDGVLIEDGDVPYGVVDTETAGAVQGWVRPVHVPRK